MTRTADRAGGSALGAMAASIAPTAPLDAEAGEAADLLGFAPAEETRFARHTVAAPGETARRPGRPPGSPNKANLDLAKLLAAGGYRHPVEFLASLYTADTRKLAAALAGHGKVELVTFDQADAALAHQRTAAKEAALYVAQQMPKAVEIRADAPRALVVIHEHGREGSAGGRGGRPHGAMSIHDPITLEGQALSDDARLAATVANDAGSHDEGSHDGG